MQHNCYEGRCVDVEGEIPVNPRQEGSSICLHIKHTNHNSYLLNAFSHHAPDYHRRYSGLEPRPISDQQMLQALQEGLQNWRHEHIDDDDELSD
ncbi:hypothetical protein PGT21_002578 [Puccinia graminis f. sp. tritici]|uniref:Uncharacterized protein n=1 Tax=Puccinia graminis f. sp. tritici TaxID=56615 RepID=A0A5B0MWZ0_PUCGR|nr:hypothetical protein PGT21_002578 [Puccinia graminis f. sp. tritici]